jgi:DeoR family fructose operon transcriptional repressor
MRQRQQKILEHIHKVGIASLAELAQMFGVSEFTIRRDIDYLASARLLAKVKGGAQRIESPSHFHEARLPSRMKINVAQKEKIAAKALEFIHPGETIFLDGSSTIAALARCIAQTCHNITVVTNSVLVVLELCEGSDIRLIGLGGIFDQETMSYVGFDQGNPTEAFNFDKAFFSCTGFVPLEGTFENAAFNRNTKRLAADHADKVFLLIDESKFGQRALTRVLDTSQLNTVITDKLNSNEINDQLSRQKVRVVVAENSKA